MKQLLLSSIVLLLFSASVLLFQLSCQKELMAQTNYVLPPATTNSLGGVTVGNGLSVTSNGVLSIASLSGTGLLQLNKVLYIRYHDGGNNEKEIWLANTDGSNPVKVSLQLPTGLELDSEGGVKLTPDGKKIVFTAYSPTMRDSYIYTCNADGSELKKIVDKYDRDWGYIVEGTY